MFARQYVMVVESNLGKEGSKDTGLKIMRTLEIKASQTLMDSESASFGIFCGAEASSSS